MSDQLQLIISAQVGKPIDLEQSIELSVSNRIYEILQLDSSEVRNFYQMFPTRPDSKRLYYVAPLGRWIRVLHDLYERSSGGWSSDCALPRSVAERFQDRLIKAVQS